MGFAVLHVGWALAVPFAFGVLVLAIGAWEQEHVRKRCLQDWGIDLGVPVTALENEALGPRVMEYLSHRYSSELLRNQLADLCGMVRSAWGVLATVVQVVALAVVGWQMYESGSEVAVAMSSVPALALFFWLVSFALSLACLLFTGRYPGEPKEERKSLTASIEAQRDSVQPSTAYNAGWRV
jgi:hypothetical protein